MDPQRLTVDLGLLHHAVTPLWEDKSKAWLAQWFSDNGFTRGYGGNPANWNGNINPFTGARSYSQTHAVGQRVTSATPDATADERKMGYRVFYIVRNPEQRITYHAGNWNVNQRSIAIENLGDYRNYPLRDKDMQVIADFFRPLDRKVGGRMSILLHNEVIGTICPARIAEGRNRIVQYINSPPAAPAPAPAPKPPAKAELVWNQLPHPETYLFNKDTELYNFDSTTWGGIKSSDPRKTFKKGEQITIYGTVLNKTLNATYLLTEHSYTGKVTHGVNTVDLDRYVPPKPEPKPEPAPEEPEKPQEPSEPDTQDEGSKLLQGVIRALKPLWEYLVKLWNAKY